MKFPAAIPRIIAVLTIGISDRALGAIDTQLPVITVQGCYLVTYHSDWFRPRANLDESWDIIGEPKDFEQRLAQAFGTGRPGQVGREVFLSIHARVGPKGRFGHWGQGSREIEILEVLEMRRSKLCEGVPAPPPPNYRIERTREASSAK